MSGIYPDDCLARPEYTPEYCRHIYAYFNVVKRVERQVAKEVMSGSIKKVFYERVPCPLPTFEGFAQKISATVEDIENWRLEHPKFDYVCRKCEDMQRHILINNGLEGLYPAVFMKVAAVNMLGWKDSSKGDKKKDLGRITDKDLAAEISKRTAKHKEGKSEEIDNIIDSVDFKG